MSTSLTELIKIFILSYIQYLRYGTYRLEIKYYILSYFIGIFLAVVLWKIFIEPLDLDIDLTYGLLIFLLIFLGLGFVFTKAFKCVAIIVCVSLFGKKGRMYLRALCMTFIIAGPISNLALNGQETVRVFACTTILTYNLTKTRFDLLTKPFQNTMKQMKGEMADFRNNFASIKDVVQPIKEEILSDFQEEVQNSSKVNPIVERFIRQDILPALSFADPTNQSLRLSKAKAIRERYSKKMHLRCKEQLKKGENRCKNAFANAHEKCMQKLPVVVDKLLCWPLQIDYICNMRLLGYKDSGGVCDPSDVIDPKLGENMIDLQETQQQLFQNINGSDISLKVVKIEKPPRLRAAEDTAKAVMEEINVKRKMFDYIIGIMKWIFSFVFLKVIYSSIKYHSNYLSKIDFDNIYITPYFRRINQRRLERNQHTVLPLKKFQSKSLVDTEKSCNLTKEESRALTYLYLQFLLEICISGFLMLLDHLLVVLLKIVHSVSEITYYQEGEHVISFYINGTGLMARLMRSTLKNFSMHERVHTFLTNEPCLPRPSALSKSYYMKIFAIYFVVLLLIYYSTVTMRSRMYICGFFYRKREKQRTLHLYNKMLKGRKALFETMYRKVKDDIHIQRLKMKLNFLSWLRLNHPRYFGWLRWFKFARRKCLICGEPEPRSDSENLLEQFVECSGYKCYFIYCAECWRDIGEECLACLSPTRMLIKICSCNYT